MKNPLEETPEADLKKENRMLYQRVKSNALRTRSALEKMEIQFQT